MHAIVYPELYNHAHSLHVYFRHNLGTVYSKRLPFRSCGSHYSHFLTENEIESASFFDASIFDPIFQSENGKEVVRDTTVSFTCPQKT